MTNGAENSLCEAGKVVDVEGDGGVVVEWVTKKAESECAAEGHTVLVNYVGRVAATGKEFDRNHGGYPFAFTIGDGSVVRGFECAAKLLRLGDQVKVTLSPAYAYGEAGSGEDVPPGSSLVFDIEVVEIKENNTKGERAALDRERLAALRAEREKAEQAFKDKRDDRKAKAEQTKAAMAAKLANKKGKSKGGGGKKQPWVNPADKKKAAAEKKS